MSERTAADVVREWREWQRKYYVECGSQISKEYADAELVSRINYLVETEIARREDEWDRQGKP